MVYQMQVIHIKAVEWGWYFVAGSGLGNIISARMAPMSGRAAGARFARFGGLVGEYS